MNKIKELPIGTKIELPFANIIVEKADEFIHCSGCIFEFIHDCYELSIPYGTCMKGERSDKTDVIFSMYEKHRQ